MTWNRVRTATGRLAMNELRSLHSLPLWVARRRHGVPAGAHAAPYTEPQNAVMWVFIGVSALEGVLLAMIVPWPLVHATLLFVHIYGLLLMLGMQAACVTRPHVAGPDGSLRLRYAGLFDLTIPAGSITGVRVERRYVGGRLVSRPAEDELDLVVGGQTTVTVELTAPVTYVRPLGRTGRARVIRFQADDPAALVAAVRAGRAAVPDAA
jgi:hypothetical protein